MAIFSASLTRKGSTFGDVTLYKNIFNVSYTLQDHRFLHKLISVAKRESGMLI
jgi:hypothetical protein